MSILVECYKLAVARLSIPSGLYCYEPQGKMDKHGRLKTKMCPFWGIDPNHERQNNGYCRYLDLKDWEDDGFPMLWDQVKCCGVNDEIDEADLNWWDD